VAEVKNDDYLNSIIKDLTEVLWEEHGTGARYRTPLVGVDYFQKKYGSQLKKSNWLETLDAVLGALKEEGLIDGASYEREDFILTINFRSCLHRPMEKQLIDNGVNIINCPCANVVMHFVDQLVGKYSELVKVDFNEDGCVATICVMGNISA
jgi:hypothetical protein